MKHVKKANRTKITDAQARFEADQTSLQALEAVEQLKHDITFKVRLLAMTDVASYTEIETIVSNAWDEGKYLFTGVPQKLRQEIRAKVEAQAAGN